MSNNKDKPADTAKNHESSDFGKFKEGVVTVIVENNTVQRLDPGPTRAPQRTSGEGSGSGSTKKK